MIIVFYTLLHLVVKSRKFFISFYQQPLINFGSDHLEVKKTQQTSSKKLIITASSITKIDTPVGLLTHIKQRLCDEKKLSKEDARKILNEYIVEEEKYNSTIIRSKKDWKPRPERTPEQLKILKLTNQKMTEYKLFCKELGPYPTLDQMKEREKLNGEVCELMHQLCAKNS
ncbi:uncharacterized protein LOC122857048 [Aphidius gifuensis]|uniref:uncharacterized protein LOC122857048 n=1 Tax=Aphidius gifuensis TaxID=684658 RepID=UPI001CDC0306|nr:uncharacterized protein LOC122857048 [Aphidius gifuensis]